VDPASVRARFAALVRDLQGEWCAALERLDGEGTFVRDAWAREGGGGGVTRVLEDGALLEKAGVNVSDVEGPVPAELAPALPGKADRFTATGISLVLHPRSPMIPTTHANFRFLTHGDTAWFGGGADLTPWYLFDDDAAAFHRALRAACERHDPGFYPRMKAACDAYFFLPHRREGRGVGGIFFDHFGGDDTARALAFVEDVARAFLPAWIAIAERRRREPFGARERAWQEQRRSRYVEFNLLHDRGTAFGLRSGGRVESIFMSMPPRVRFSYDRGTAPESREARLLDVLRAPREWA
jgi:coproporphyrinogen III oxidase